MDGLSDRQEAGAQLAMSLPDAVEAALQRLLPQIRADGGELEVVSIEDGIVRVAMKGACLHCALAAHTLGHLRREIAALCDIPVRVLPAN